MSKLRGLPKHMRWAQEWDDELTRLHRLGTMSARQLSHALSETFHRPFTRNAIIGRCGRLGLAQHRLHVPAPKPRKPRASRAKSVSLAKAPITSEDQLLRADGSRGDSNTSGWRRLNNPEQIAAARVGHLPNIMSCEIVKPEQSFERTDFELCKWPMSDAAGLHVCGSKATIGAYCTEHAQRAYRTMPTRGRNKILRAQISHHGASLRQIGHSADLDIELADITVTRIAEGGKL